MPKSTSHSTKKSKKIKKPATNKQKWLNLLKIVLLIVVLYFSGRTVLHYVQTQITYRQDKVRFAQTESDMNDAYNAIVKAVGKPYETKISKGCAYGALKYARGPLGCGIGYSLIYGTESTDTGRALTNGIFSSIDGKFGFSSARNTTPYNMTDIQNAFTADYSSRNKLACELNYYLWSKKDFNEIVAKADTYKTYTSNDDKVAVYSFGCNRDVPRAIYNIESSTN